MKTKLVLAVAVLLLPWAALAQAPPGVARGVIVAIESDTLTLKLADGASEKIALGKDWKVSVLKPVSVDTIQPGSFIGTAEMPQKDGTGRSLEVHVFPPGVKAGEGHYDWDLKQGSKMTNGTVGKVTASGKGRQLQVSYPNGERQITVPPNVPVVQITPGERALAKPGTPAFLIVGKDPGGALSSNGIAVGENGAVPPM
ncbi:MAG TPA: hypothetical protein VH209_12235 [Steroidobacteraceae bacterium]|jgi:hypothetical protein|nr:hypothetical protein [Steroidobacteraceae bacterium]